MSKFIHIKNAQSYLLSVWSMLCVFIVNSQCNKFAVMVCAHDETHSKLTAQHHSTHIKNVENDIISN